MNYRRILFAAVAFGVSLAACAEESGRDTFGKWRFAVGGGFNGAVRSSIGMRNLPAPSGYVVPVGMRQVDALENAQNHEYGDDGYIRKTENDNGFSTENWKLSTDRYVNYDPNPENGYFDLRNAYEKVVSSALSSGYSGYSDDPYPFGVSVEVSRELWLHDEAFENRWGVDFVAGFSYYFQRDVYRGYGSANRTDTVLDGEYQTIIRDPDAMYEYIEEKSDSPVGGMYGHGNLNYDYISPALQWERINQYTPKDLGGQTRTVSSSRMYSARGDYRELEMLFMLRPWYEITDWWRVYGELGVGVSWGNFESEVYGSGLSCGEDFSKWDCYGVAGLGTMFRYGMFDLSLDFLGRFLRDDLDVDGRYLNGAIRRSDWGFRVMVGVEF